MDPHSIDHDKAARGAAGLFSLQGFHGPGSLPDSFVGLLNSFVPLPDGGSGDLDRGLQGLGGLLGYEAWRAPGGSLDDARKQGGSLGLPVRPDGQDRRAGPLGTERGGWLSESVSDHAACVRMVQPKF